MMKQTLCIKGNSPQKGIALLLVLWALALLLGVSMSFAWLVRTEAGAAMGFGEIERLKWLAEAGMERAASEVLYRFTYKHQNVLLEDREVMKTDGTTYTGSLGRGEYRFRIRDESGKLNVNQLSDRSGTVLKRFLVNAGFSAEQAETAVDSILDWKDADELHRLHGAESEYYGSLPSPYRAKNADFETIEELLFVKGITEEMLFGAGGKPGLIHVLSVHAPGDKISLLSAPKELIAAVPGVTEEMADRIVQARQQVPDISDPDIRGILGALYMEVSNFCRIGDSDTYAIEAEGREGGRMFRIAGTIKVLGNGRYVYLSFRNPSG